jgi:hypothetical protein
MWEAAFGSRAEVTQAGGYWERGGGIDNEGGVLGTSTETIEH